MRMGETYRYVRLTDARRQLDKSGELESVVDGLPSFLCETLAPDGTLTILERGINPIKTVDAVDGQRRPAICIRSSPHKTGSATTPWQDHFDPDIGHVRYFGDAKPGQRQPPEEVPGNKVLLAEFAHHEAVDRSGRLAAAPIILMLAVPAFGRAKGQVKFQGLGVLARAERVVQWDVRLRTSFVNYGFDFTVLDLSAENEEFDWTWINARRDRKLGATETLKIAPAAWRRWVRDGEDALPIVRRRVSKLRTLKPKEQMPESGTRVDSVLRSVYAFYDGRKHRFEGLAEAVTERILVDSGADYRRGWLTAASSDGGADFIGRLDVGSGPATTKLVVLGQAKCILPSSPTSGLHIARVVARLRRGWVGAFVTTSYFSEPAQREVIEDRYPIMLIAGRQLAETVSLMMSDNGLEDVSEYLTLLDSFYDGRVASRDPEEILLEA